MNDLVSLEEANKRRLALIEWAQRPKPNGIRCPACGCELLDTNPSVVYTSNPPLKDVACCSCDYKGQRVA